MADGLSPHRVAPLRMNLGRNPTYPDGKQRERGISRVSHWAIPYVSYVRTRAPPLGQRTSGNSILILPQRIAFAGSVVWQVGTVEYHVFAQQK